MIDNKGWVKTYRSLMDKGYYTDSQAVHLWIHIIFKANHSEKEFMWNGSIINVKRGSFVTGRKRLSAETGIAESKIYRLLKLFESERQIEQQTNNRNSMITILNYDQYQSSEQQMNNKRTTSEQPVNTNKELKHSENDKELKREKRKRFTPPLFVDVQKRMMNTNLKNHLSQSRAEEEAEKFINFYTSNGWKVGKNKMVSWESAVSNWLMRLEPEAKIADIDWGD